MYGLFCSCLDVSDLKKRRDATCNGEKRLCWIYVGFVRVQGWDLSEDRTFFTAS